MSAKGLEGAQKPPQAQGVSARRIGLFCFVAVAELVQGIDHSARFSERPFAVRQGPVTAFHRFEVVAREDVDRVPWPFPAPPDIAPPVRDILLGSSAFGTSVHYGT
jgi:hypothetical protein